MNKIAYRERGLSASVDTFQNNMSILMMLIDEKGMLSSPTNQHDYQLIQVCQQCNSIIEKFLSSCPADEINARKQDIQNSQELHKKFVRDFLPIITLYSLSSSISLPDEGQGIFSKNEMR